MTSFPTLSPSKDERDHAALAVASNALAMLWLKPCAERRSDAAALREHKSRQVGLPEDRSGACHCARCGRVRGATCCKLLKELPMIHIYINIVT